MQQRSIFITCKNCARAVSVTGYVELPTEGPRSDARPRVSRPWAKGKGRESGSPAGKASQWSEGLTKFLSWPETHCKLMNSWDGKGGYANLLILLLFYYIITNSSNDNILLSLLDSAVQYNPRPLFVMAVGQRWSRHNLHCISSSSHDCIAQTETPLSLLCCVFQTVPSSVLCAAPSAGSGTPSQPFRLYLQKHKHKIIFIVHSICPAMTPHKTSTLKIWVNTLDSSLQMLWEVVLSMSLIKSC